MKIAFFTNCYLPYLSGITLSISTLTNELRNLGHKVCVVGPTYPKHKESDPDIIRLPSLPATYPGYRLVFPFSFKLLNLFKIKPDIIHAHQPFGVGLLALLLARWLKIPLIYTFHTLFPRYVHHAPFLPQRISKGVVSNYLSFFCNQTDMVIAPSEMVRRYLITQLKIQKPVEVIPTGINLEPLKNRSSLVACRLALRKKYNLSPEAKLLLYVGRLSDEKNVAFLLEMFSKIREKNVYLMLVGSGPKEREYKNLAQKLNIQKRTVFAGQIKHPEIYDYYRAADLFVYASTSETQGLVLVEAKACGLPIVALFGGGISDVIENGVDGYVTPRDQNFFIDHLLRLLKDDQLRKGMSFKAQEDVSLRFSARKIAEKMEGIYRFLKIRKSCRGNSYSATNLKPNCWRKYFTCAKGKGRLVGFS